jgi:hypothetical protein
MATTAFPHRPGHRVEIVATRTVAVGLALATAWIHAWLGGTLFLLNAAGYTVLAITLVAPLPGALRDSRWLIRLALLGFTIVTIAGWAAFGARFWVAYLDKAIELALVVAVGVDIWLSDGGPVGVVRRVRRAAAGLTGG